MKVKFPKIGISSEPPKTPSIEADVEMYSRCLKANKLLPQMQAIIREVYAREGMPIEEPKPGKKDYSATRLAGIYKRLGKGWESDPAKMQALYDKWKLPTPQEVK